MKIALCQINPTVGNFDSNKKKVLNYYSNALRLNADIVVFPELTITGYPPQDLLLENGFVNERERVGNIEVAQRSLFDTGTKGQLQLPFATIRNWRRGRKVD